MEKDILEILMNNKGEVDNFNDAVFGTDFIKVTKELDALFAKRIVSQQRELLLQAFKDGFQAATDSIVGANEAIKNKTLQ